MRLSPQCEIVHFNQLQEVLTKWLPVLTKWLALHFCFVLVVFPFFHCCNRSKMKIYVQLNDGLTKTECKIFINAYYTWAEMRQGGLWTCGYSKMLCVHQVWRHATRHVQLSVYGSLAAFVSAGCGRLGWLHSPFSFTFFFYKCFGSVRCFYQCNQPVLITAPRWAKMFSKKYGKWKRQTWPAEINASSIPQTELYKGKFSAWTRMQRCRLPIDGTRHVQLQWCVHQWIR